MMQLLARQSKPAAPTPGVRRSAGDYDAVARCGSARRAATVSTAHIAARTSATPPARSHASGGPPRGGAAAAREKAEPRARGGELLDADRADHPQAERDVAGEVQRDAAAQ